MPRVVFAPASIAVAVSRGETLLNAAIEAGVTRVSCCGMAPPCARCRMTVLDGEASLTPPTQVEVEFLRKRHFLPGQRLACLACVHGDVEIEVYE